jgi:hypothetical protein
MQVMNWAVMDGDHGNYLGVDFKYYLLAMSANYAFFIPDDDAFDAYYIDPASLARTNGEDAYALHFYYDANTNTNYHLRCDRYHWNNVTQTLGSFVGSVTNMASVKTQLIDLLNYHTVVLNSGETIGTNHYYKTKHGAEIYVSGDGVGDYVASGGQLDNGLSKAKIENDYAEKNGHAYRLNHVIQSTQNSVFHILSSNSQFSDFLNVCSGFTPDNALMAWAGISSEKNDVGIREVDAYTVFTNVYGSGTNAVSDACIDYNVKFFNTYNYTLYAPDNAAMKIAYAAGLPTWEEIQAMYDQYGDDASADIKAEAKQKIMELRNFVRYHFQSVSLYADNNVESGEYQTLCSNSLGISLNLTVSSASGNGKLIVEDAAGVKHTIDGSGSLMANKMARDMWLGNSSASSASSASTAEGIYTSSFCAVHEISEPLYYNATKDYANGVASAKSNSAKAKSLMRSTKKH